MGESSGPLLPRKEVKDVKVEEEPKLKFWKKPKLKAAKEDEDQSHSDCKAGVGAVTAFVSACTRD